MGGWITLNTAVEYPSRVSALILNSPAAGLPVKTTWMKYLNDIIFTSSVEKHRKAARFLLGNGRATRDWEEYMVQVVADTGGAKMGIPADIKTENFSRLTMPVLLLVGKNEVIYKNNQDIFDMAKSLLPSVQCEWIPDAGHMGAYLLRQTASRGESSSRAEPPRQKVKAQANAARMPSIQYPPLNCYCQFVVVSAAAPQSGKSSRVRTSGSFMSAALFLLLRMSHC